jgi:tRNA pseudouridine38-40 synthase
MRVVRLDLEYDGTRFHGFAPQPGVRTVAGELGAVLSRLLGGPVPLSAGGRTDAGVHARGQVVSFVTDSSRTVREMKKALDALLADDVLIRSAAEAPEDFDARRSARSRRYSYTIWNAMECNLWERHYMLHVPDPLNVDAMHEACQAVVGRHDFAAFRTHKSQDDGEKGTVRRVHTADWCREAEQPEVVRFDIEADAFLRHMVRVIVGSALQVGLGKQPVDSIAAMLASAERAAAGPTAPSHGLALERVTYADLTVVGPPDSDAPDRD